MSGGTKKRSFYFQIRDHRSPDDPYVEEIGAEDEHQVPNHERSLQERLRMRSNTVHGSYEEPYFEPDLFDEPIPQNREPEENRHLRDRRRVPAEPAPSRESGYQEQHKPQYQERHGSYENRYEQPRHYSSKPQPQQQPHPHEPYHPQEHYQEFELNQQRKFQENPNREGQFREQYAPSVSRAPQGKMYSEREPEVPREPVYSHASNPNYTGQSNQVESQSMRQYRRQIENSYLHSERGYAPQPLEQREAFVRESMRDNRRVEQRLPDRVQERHGYDSSEPYYHHKSSSPPYSPERNEPQHRHYTTPAPEEEEFGCYICDWRGYITKAGAKFAEVKKCQCQQGVCRKCGGEGGYETTLESGNIAWKKCECQQFFKKIDLYSAARIPARFAMKTIEAYAPSDETQDRVKKHLDRLFFNQKTGQPFQKGSKGVLLMGPTGVGKTHLTIGLIRRLLLEQNVQCRFVDFGLLLSELKDCFNRGMSQRDVLLPYMEVEVLLVDDLGKGRNSLWELQIIDELLSARYNANKTTFITTNYTDRVETTLRERSRGRGRNDGEEILLRDTLLDRVGDRIYSRLQEMCSFFYIKGTDYRNKRR